MIPYRVGPASSLPLASLAQNTFGAVFRQWNKDGGEARGTKYLAFFQLSDLWALDRQNYIKRPEALTSAYIFDRVEHFCGEDLRSGICGLVLDLSNEGHPYHHQSFADLHTWCEAKNISPSRIALMSQNRAIKVSYQNMNRSTSEPVRFVTYDRFIAAVAAAMEKEGALFESSIGFNKNARRCHDPKLEIKTFLCLNGTPRPIRVSVLAALASAGVLNDTLWSLLKEASGKSRFTLTDTETLMMRLGRQTEIPNAAIIMSGPPKVVDKIEVPNSNMLIMNIDLNSYNQTFMSIVTETDFSSGENRRITEKLIKSLAMGHPAIVFGNPESMTLAREFGFQTFSPLINETYDELFDPAERFKAALNEIVTLHASLANRDAPQRRQLAEIGSANLAHAFDGEFRRRYADVVEKPLVQALLELLS